MESGVAGIVLAGGLARRMGGGDKGLLRLGGQTILERVIARLRPQVAVLALNANGDPARFADCGLPVLPDAVGGFAGPLAGILAGLDWCALRTSCRWLASAPCDTPFLPPDLVARLREAAKGQGAAIALAASGGRTHPVVGLWPVDLRGDLRQALVAEGVRKVDAFAGRHAVATVAFETAGVDPFLNVNTPADLAAAEGALAAPGHS